MTDDSNMDEIIDSLEAQLEDVQTEPDMEQMPFRMTDSGVIECRIFEEICEMFSHAAREVRGIREEQLGIRVEVLADEADEMFAGQLETLTQAAEIFRPGIFTIEEGKLLLEAARIVRKTLYEFVDTKTELPAEFLNLHVLAAAGELNEEIESLVENFGAEILAIIAMFEIATVIVSNLTMFTELY
jgi:hypothetical protein